MKNKIAVFLSITVLFLCFYFVQPVSAANKTLNELKNEIYGSIIVIDYTNPSDGYSYFRVLCQLNNNWFVVNNGSIGGAWNTTTSIFGCSFNPLTNPDTPMGWYEGSYHPAYTYNTFAVLVKGSLYQNNNTNNTYFPNTGDYLESIEPKWYEILWSDFKDFVSDLGFALLTPFDPNSIIDIADWFENSWTVKVGEGEDNLANQIEVITPTPTPVPPTPIPYQTVIVPDGNGGSIVQYKYLNPSGTPIISDQPPQQNVTVNNDDNDGFEYPYYENPDNKDNPFKFKIPWYLKLVLRHNDIDIDTLDDHYQVAQNQVQSDEVVEAVNEVYNGFQVLPTDWLLLLGAIASIPLFAALIHRFLQG